MLECVINVSEGRDEDVLDKLRAAAGLSLLDLHSDVHHNRAVLTLAGTDVEGAARRIAAAGVRHIDLGAHAGVHPRLGAVDVVPFVPLEGSTIEEAVVARNAFASWAADTLDLPCFLYGPGRSLPDVRREAFRSLTPDIGPSEPHPSAGAICVGARPVLIAYNLWLVPGTDVTVASKIATAVRGPAIRALGLDLEGVAQVSLNLLDWTAAGPAEVYDVVAAQAAAVGTAIARAELVGLLPTPALESIPPERWPELGLDAAATIEARLARVVEA
jgi:glutamate formiminotransferase